MSSCKPEVRTEHGVCGPREWSVDVSSPELFKGGIDFDHANV